MIEKTNGASAWSRLATVSTVVALVLPSVAGAQETFEVVESTSDGRSFNVRCTATFFEDALVFGKLMGYDTVRLEGAGCLNETGQPMLPAQTLRVALPAGMAVTDVRIAQAESMKLVGKYMLCPAQPPRPMSDPATVEEFVGADPEIYASPKAYPGRLVEIAHQTDLAGQAIACIRVYPLQYAPAAKQLTLHTSIQIVLEGVGGYACGDFLPERVSVRGRAAYERMLASTVVNPVDVELRAAGGLPATRGVGPGEYDYVIITSSGWVDDFQPLADWRTKKGVPTTIVTTDWIYNDGGYVGSNLEKVRAFIQDAHANWGAGCFLLGGDSNTIPYHVRTITVPGYWTHDIANDTYYADYDEDWSCEVHVSRAPVRTISQINTFIDKVLAYEKNPPLSVYAKTAAFFGFDITDPNDQDGEISKEIIRSLYLPASWTLSTEYDREPGTHKADIIGYLNAGHHLVNHHDHCDTELMGAGWINHAELLYISDVDALTNGDRQSILFAVGCRPANFPAYTSIGEAFVQNPHGGGVAFIGNTYYGWGGAAPDPVHYTVLQDHLLFKSLFDEGLCRLGECFSYLKNNAYEGADPYNLNQYCFTQLTLLGEPELSIWTEDPQDLTVTHDDTLVVGELTAFPVQVSSGGGPVDQASVCLWKDGDVYEIEPTDPSGIASFGIAPGSIGTMCVTVSKHNYLPYEGQAEVVPDYIGDVDRDGDVDVSDLAALLAAYNACSGDPSYNPAADFDDSGCVGLPDLAALLGNYGAGT
jgi:hypothetical protein